MQNTLRTFLATVIILFSSGKIWAGNVDSTFSKKSYNMYVEGFGPESKFSVNYEKPFKIKKKYPLAFKIGIGMDFRVDTTVTHKNLTKTTFALIPITISRLFVKRTYTLEVGTGLILRKPTGAGMREDVTFVIGYRKSFGGNKYYYKLAFTPVVSFIGQNFDVAPYIGIGIGRRFF